MILSSVTILTSHDTVIQRGQNSDSNSIKGSSGFCVQLSPKHLKNLDLLIARYMAATVAAAAESGAAKYPPRAHPLSEVSQRKSRRAEGDFLPSRLWLASSTVGTSQLQLQAVPSPGSLLPAHFKPCPDWTWHNPRGGRVTN